MLPGRKVGPQGGFFAMDRNFTWMHMGVVGMKIGEWLKSEVEYGRDLAGSGLHGARAGAGSALAGQSVGDVLGRSARASWAPSVLGAGVAAAAALLAQRRRKNIAIVAAMSAVGAVVGFAAGVAWETRELSGGIARGALREMGTMRDSHWLGKHPINFG